MNLKRIFWTCFMLLATTLLLRAQIDDCLGCKKYKQFIEQADEYLEGERFDKALIEFQAAQLAARVCKCSSNAPAVGIEQSIKGIQRQREEAEQERDKARRERAKTLLEKARADSLARVAAKGREVAENALQEMQKAQDSILTLNLQRALRNEVEYLQQIGQEQFRSKNYEKAQKSYAEVVNLLAGIEPDSSNTRQMETAKAKLPELERLSQLKKNFRQHIALGDSMAKKSNYPSAFYHYFKALESGFDNEISKNHLLQLEEQLGYEIKRNKKIEASQYLRLIALSAHNNSIHNNNERFSRRMREALQLEPVDTIFESFPELQQYAQTYKQQFLHRLRVSAGLKMYFPRWSPEKVLDVSIKDGGNSIEYPLTHWLTSLGLSYRISGRHWIKIMYNSNDVLPGSSSRHYDNFPSISSIDDFDNISGNLYRYPLPTLNEVAINGTMELFRIVNKQWKTRRFSLEADGGFIFGFGKLGLSNEYIELAFEHAAAPKSYFSKLISATGQQVRVDVNTQEDFYRISNPRYADANGSLSDKSYVNFLSCKNMLIQLPFTNAFSRFNYFNGNLGLTANYRPFPKSPIQLVGTLAYNFSIQRTARSVSFNLGEQMYDTLESGGEIDEPTIDALQDYYLNQCNIDIAIDPSFRQFTSGLSFGIGIGTRL